MTETWNGHRWTVQHPAAIKDRPGLGPDRWNFVTAVACASQRSCVGAGYIPLTQGASSPRAFAIRWNGQTWSAALKGLPRFAEPLRRREVVAETSEGGEDAARRLEPDEVPRIGDDLEERVRR